MIFGSLFTGIGGMDLGLERAGMRCAWQVELDPFCRRVLEKHWPGVHRHDDVRTFNPTTAVDLVAGGFPCQPVSCAGKRRGEADPRWLWPEFLRVVRACRPAWVLAENVPGLRTRGADRVLGDLEAEGYAVAPLVVGAEDVGAPHRRKRVWIVAALRDADGRGRGGHGVGEQPEPAERREVSDAAGRRRDRSAGELVGQRPIGLAAELERDGTPRPVPNAHGAALRLEPGRRQPNREGAAVARAHGEDGALADAHGGAGGREARTAIGGSGAEATQGWTAELGRCGGGREVADADRVGRELQRQPEHAGEQGASGLEPDRCGAERRRGWPLGSPSGQGSPQRQRPEAERTHAAAAGAGWWAAEPDVGRVAHGVRSRVDRLRALGNACVPQVVEEIGRAILKVRA